MSENTWPKAYEKNIRQHLGKEADIFLESLSGNPNTAIRLNPAKPCRPGFAMEKIPWTSNGFYLAERPVFTLDPLLHSGGYYVQEPSSMFLEYALRQVIDKKKPLLALDLCAAPGGKSTHLLSIFNEDSLIISNEVIRSRAVILQENMVKWGLPNKIIISNDPEDFLPLGPVFDLIVVDAPCSGEGLFRKDPSAANEWSEKNVQICVARQQRILEKIKHTLKPGGILVYSTCTFQSAENEGQVMRLIQHDEFESLSLDIPPEWGVMENKENQCFGYRFYPGKVRGEGFFMSVLRKKGIPEERLKKKKKERYLNRLLPPGFQAMKVISPWIRNQKRFALWVMKGETVLFPREWMPVLHLVRQHLYIKYAGCKVGRVAGKDLIPAHDLALSIALTDDITKIKLGRQEALQYLAKQEIRLDGTMNKGWALVSYQDLPLGWIKILSNRVNNYYPKEWRIRMNLG